MISSLEPENELFLWVQSLIQEATRLLNQRPQAGWPHRLP